MLTAVVVAVVKGTARRQALSDAQNGVKGRDGRGGGGGRSEDAADEELGSNHFDLGGRMLGKTKGCSE